jgi:O-antigen ligase
MVRFSNQTISGMRDLLVAYAIALLGGALVLRAFAGVGLYVYAIPVVVLATVGIWRLMSPEKHRIPRVVTFYVSLWLLFICWLLASSLWRIRGIGVYTETILLVGMMGFAVLAVFALSPGVIKKAVPAFYVVGFAVAVFVFGSYLQAGSLRGYGSVLAGSYLVTARVLGLGAVAASLRLMTRGGWSTPLALTAAVLITALGFSLARGALLSTLGILLLTAIFLALRLPTHRETIWAWLRSRIKKISLGFGVIAVIGLAIVAALQVERNAVRLRRMFSGNELEVGGRGALWSTSLENITESPILGYGLGSSGVMAGAHEGYYPHNLFLQVWLDGGIVAFLLLAVLLAFPFGHAAWYLRRNGLKSSVWIEYLGLFTFLILEYSKSTDFYTARLLVIVGVMAVWAVHSSIDENSLRIGENRA